MIFWDLTAERARRHHSGLGRVCARLRQELAVLQPEGLTPVWWCPRRREFRCGSRWSHRTAALPPESPVILPAPWGEAERPGFGEWLARTPTRPLALFHDAIPLRWPEWTWPRSVARFPLYLQQLTRCRQVLAVSEEARRDLVGFWDWAEPSPRPAVGLLPLGADFDGLARADPRPWPERALRVVQTGILEPRKNQTALLAAADRLWETGVPVEVVLAGRANPHFSAPLLAEIRRRQSAGRPLRWIGQPDDPALRELYRSARAVVVPSRAEGCGLPVWEALWCGTPVVCSRLPCVAGWPEGPGLHQIDPDQTEELAEILRRLLTDPAEGSAAAEDVRCRTLPTWAESARILAAAP